MPRDDFNGDGLSDILWRNVGGQLSNWLGTAGGGFVVNDANAFASVPVDWQVVGTGDFNGDGRSDILWRNLDGWLSNWLATPGGGYSVNDANALTLVPNDWQVAGVGDFNGDGRSDILWRNVNGQLSNWLGTASGGYAINDIHAFADVPTDWQIRGVGDFDGDGRDDILWQSDAGWISNWLGAASGGFTINDDNAMFDAAYWGVTNPIATGDFNGDGRDDVLIHNSIGQLYSMESAPGGSFYPAWAIGFIQLLPAGWSVDAIGDYDGDGRDDMLWRNSDGTLAAWLSSGTGYSFTLAPASQVQVTEDWQVVDYWI